MMGVLRDTAVQKLQGWMHEYDGQRKAYVLAFARGTWRQAARHHGCGRIQARPGAFELVSSARLSMTTLTESELSSSLHLGRVSLSSRSLAHCLSISSA